MAATDKHGQAFVEGQQVAVHAAGPSPWSNHEAGDYQGVVIGVHEGGPHVLVGTGEKAYRIAPLGSECEVVS